MRDTGTWAIVGTFLLAVAAPFMVGVGLLALLSAEPWTGDARGALIGGGLVSGLGAILATLVLLVGRLRPETRRERSRKAALAVVVLTALIGPAWGTGRFLWGVQVGGAPGEADRADIGATQSVGRQPDPAIRYDAL